MDPKQEADVADGPPSLASSLGPATTRSQPYSLSTSAMARWTVVGSCEVPGRRDRAGWARGPFFGGLLVIGRCDARVGAGSDRRQLERAGSRRGSLSQGGIEPSPPFRRQELRSPKPIEPTAVYPAHDLTGQADQASISVPVSREGRRLSSRPRRSHQGRAVPGSPRKWDLWHLW
jgi:hypothetical protein